MSIERPELREIAHEPTPASISGANWARWRDIPVAVLAWFLVLFVVLWAAGHIVGTIIVLAVATLLCYALSPLVDKLARWMPRAIAIVIVYLIFLSAISGLIYLVVNTAVVQVVALAHYIQSLLSGNTQNPQLTALLNNLGITQDQLHGFGQQILSQAQNVAGTIAPVLTSIAGALIDIVVITVLSIYFVANAPRVGAWLRASAPLRNRGQVYFMLDTLNRVVGGYIRGQVTLAALVGVLVGGGMDLVFHLPYAILLGVLAFVLEFIPFLGVLASGATCVLVALTVGPITAVLVLAYFVVIHVIEGDVVGPRIVGSAVGLHPAVSLIALIAGAELFGLWGALFAAPVAGVVQALAVAIWGEWRATHPEQFPTGHTISYGVPVVPVTTDESPDATPAVVQPTSPHTPVKS